MGARGPTPKREAERRRRNKTSKPKTVEVPGTIDQPEPVEDWHPIAKNWYISLAQSGQAQFYEPSDWQLAQILAEAMSRDLKPQPFWIGSKDDGQFEMIDQPMKGASLAAYLKGMTALMVSEGDRRRAQLEIERGEATPEQPAGVTALADYRKTLVG